MKLPLTAMVGIDPSVLMLVCVIALVVLTTIIVILSRYRKCPSDKILVIYGKVGKNRDGTERSAKCIHGGASFVIPVFQSYEFLDLTPISIQVDLKNALSRQNIRIDVPSRFTVGISTEPGVMQNAAERLLGLQLSEIQELSRDIIFGQLRLIIATMDIEEINTDRDKFLAAVSSNVETELKKIGLRLINVNVTDISDESGYIVALGKEAAAKAINDAKRSVAEQDRDGSIGEANAHMDQRIKVSEADSIAIQGENEAKMKIAMSEAALKEKEAEADLIRRQRDADAKAYEAIKEAEAKKAEAEAIRFAMEQEAEGIRAKGLAEAEAIEKKAEAQKKMGEASIIEMYLEALPEVVKNAAAPLAQTDKIVMYGDGNSTKVVKDVMSSASQIIEGMKESTGIDLQALLTGIVAGKVARGTGSCECSPEIAETAPSEEE